MGIPLFVLMNLVPFIIGILVLVLGIVYRKKMPMVLFVLLLLAGIIITAYGAFWLVFVIGMSTI